VPAAVDTARAPGDAMSALVVVADKTGRPVAREEIEAMLSSCRQRAVDGEHIEISQSVGLAHQHFWITPEEVGEVQPKIHPSGSYICCDARLDERTILASGVGLDAAISTDTDLILAAYRKWGEACLDYLLGDFAFVIWDPVERVLFGARDPLGVRDLCYCDRHDVLLLASHINHILGYPGFERQVNDERITRLLMNDWSDHQTSFWLGVKYLPAAHAFRFTGRGLHIWRYWQPQVLVKTPVRDEREYVEEFHTLLARTVRDRLRVHGNCALSLSGGPDSTSLAALLAAYAGSRKLKTFSYVFSRFKSCDESNYIRDVADSLGLDAEYLPGDELGPLSHPDTWPVAMDLAVQDPYVRLDQAVQYASRNQQCRVVYYGHYSDVLLAGCRLRAAEYFSRARISEIFTRQISMSEAISALRQLAPDPIKRIYRLVAGTPGRTLAPLGQTLRVIQRSIDEKLGGHDSPQSSGQQRLARMLRAIEPQAVSSGRVASNRNHVEYIDPYWDKRLIEFILRIPIGLLSRDGYKKWLLRQAMRDQVISSVLWRKSKTSLFELFTHGLIEADSFLKGELFHRPQIVARGYVQSKWLERELHSEPNWTNFGYPLWVCICLEMWLARYG
jgi:asparagine synthase (glutamine-hydrolysing)